MMKRLRGTESSEQLGAGGLALLAGWRRGREQAGRYAPRTAAAAGRARSRGGVRVLGAARGEARRGEEWSGAERRGAARAGLDRRLRRMSTKEGAGARLHADPANVSDSLYPKIGQLVEGDELMPMSIESLCMNCHENGMTRLLFTEIPFFRQVIIMSFRCPHCGVSNNEMQPGSAVQPLGSTYRVTLRGAEGLQRQVVKSDAATFRVEELEFEIPHGKGVLTTVEGLLMSALDELRDSQEARRAHDPALADQVEAFVARLALAVAGASLPLTIVLDDPSGNSWVENPVAPKADPDMEFHQYKRTEEQQQRLGLQKETYELDEDGQAGEQEPAPQAEAQAEAQAESEAAKEARRAEIAKTFKVKPGARMGHEGAGHAGHELREDSTMMEKEVFTLPSNCPACGVEGLSKTCVTDIPFFREIVIMAFDCLECGYKTNEIKGGGAIPAQGRIITLKVLRKTGAPDCEWAQDMKRDVVKSNSAGVMIPELELEIEAGSLGGLYTTVEGLLTLARDTLFEGSAGDFARGDSAPGGRKSKFQLFEQRFRSVVDGEIDFSLVIKDPLAASFIYSPTAPEPEPRLVMADYPRSFDEDEELGLNDMNTDSYEGYVPPPADHAPPRLSAQDEGVLREPAETWLGERPGMVFTCGSQGLGYYDDVTPQAAMLRMRRLQKDGDFTHPNPLAVQEAQRAAGPGA